MPGLERHHAAAEAANGNMLLQNEHGAEARAPLFREGGQPADGSATRANVLLTSHARRLGESAGKSRKNKKPIVFK